jgi:hypothetical protein
MNMSDDDNPSVDAVALMERLTDLCARRDDKLRAAAATVADVIAMASELRERRAADAALRRTLGEPQPKRTRKRRPTLTGVARQAERAGIEVARYEVRPDGINIVPGKPAAASVNDNDTATDHSWDDIDAQAKTKPAAH